MDRYIRYRDIIFYRTLAGLKSEARKNYLGYIWFVLEPLLTTGVLYFALTNLTGRSGPEVALSLLLGMITWQWFESSVMLSSGSIAGKFHVHMQVPLPKYLFPLVDVCSNTIKFGVAFILLLVACLFIGAGPSRALLWLPILLLLQLALITGISLTVSIAVTLVADLRVPLASFFRILFFVSGVFFASSRLPPHLVPYFYANPMAVLIEAYREVILHQTSPDLTRLAVAALITAGFLALGCAVNASFDKKLLKLTNV